MNNNLKSIDDDRLYNLCKRYGENARFWRQKFIGLLPEVFKRRLYEKKGFSSVFEFGKKLAGLSEEQVRLVLNLEKRFEKTPVLKSLLITGQVSVNKLARVASIAKPENEMFLATQVQVLSRDAIETLVRDCHLSSSGLTRGSRLDSRFRGNDRKNQDDNGLQKTFFEPKSLHVQMRHEASIAREVPSSSLPLSLSPEIHQKLLELQQKGIDINTLLLEFLRKREQEIDRKKEEISKQIVERESVTRYISVPIKKILKEEYGAKCSITSCQKPATVIHHQQRFSVSRSHDPKYLIPLCKEHHELAHSADLAYHEIRGQRM